MLKIQEGNNIYHDNPIFAFDSNNSPGKKNSKFIEEKKMGNWNRSRSERERERAVTRCCRRLWQRTRSGKHDHLERKWWPQGRILFLCCSYSLSLSFDPSCSSSSSSVLYVCVFKNSAKSETPGRRGLLLLVYRYFFLLKKYGKCFFFFFFFQTFAIFGRWDSFFFFF